jgi:hypothetical protein
MEFYLDALFDWWCDMVETNWALQEGENVVGVHSTQLQAGLLLEHSLHPDPATATLCTKARCC